MADPIRTAEADPIPYADLTELGGTTGRAVSIFLPTARGGAEVRENPIRAKSLIKEAEALLRAHGASEEETAEILGPLVTLLEDDPYWNSMADGLAMFAAKGIWRAYRLTTDLPEAVHVSDRFALRPIVPAAVGDRTFLVVAVSQNKVRLLEGTATTIRELDLGSIPSSVDDMAGDTQPPPHQQQRFSAGAGAGHAGSTAGGGIVPATARAPRSATCNWRSSCARSRTGSRRCSSPTIAASSCWRPSPSTCRGSASS